MEGDFACMYKDSVTITDPIYGLVYMYMYKLTIYYVLVQGDT